MEEIFRKKQVANCMANIVSTTSRHLTMHKDSQPISKAKPKIRIIHIFAPEIIKTDAANFRELVQRLTGKPNHHQDITSSCNKKQRRSIASTRRSREDQPLINNNNNNNKGLTQNKMEMRTGCCRSSVVEGATTRDRIKGEEEAEIWKSSLSSCDNSSSGGFLSGFADMDGFMQELGGFPVLPMDASHHMHLFGESQFA